MTFLCHMSYSDIVSVHNSKEAINASVPPSCGVYFFKKGTEILYIGKSVNLKARLLSHLENARLDNKEAAIIQNSETIEYVIAESEFKALLLESDLIRKHKPKYNARWRDDKSYLYIKITIKDEYPKIFAVRREYDNKSKYFGPFPSMYSIEEILKEIRKIFTFCTQKQLSKTPCFYSKINLCRPCPNVINKTIDPEVKARLKREYRNNIRHIIKIFEGKTDIVLKGLYAELKSLTHELRYEEALALRNKVYRFEHLIHDRIFSSGHITDEYNQSEARTKNLLTILHHFFPDLQKLNRIECYDISNLSQKEATASMVVFTDGLSDTSQYRKFKIKDLKLQSDFDMLEEVIKRRFNHDWLRPDLLVVDGGRPQVRRVAHVLRSLNVGIPLIGIAKHPDRFVINVDNYPIVRPPVHSLGFGMIRALRDESHRFAKKYHLLLRNKKLNMV